jgi:hypothetical protein
VADLEIYKRIGRKYTTFVAIDWVQSMALLEPPEIVVSGREIRTFIRDLKTLILCKHPRPTFEFPVKVLTYPKHKMCERDMCRVPEYSITVREKNFYPLTEKEIETFKKIYKQTIIKIEPLKFM